MDGSVKITKAPDGRPEYNPTHRDIDRGHREHNPPAPRQGEAPRTDVTRREK